MYFHKYYNKKKWVEKGACKGIQGDLQGGNVSRYDCILFHICFVFSKMRKKLELKIKN